MSLRYCMPIVQGRGAGLGNELVPWARAHLMAQVLGARAIPPAFGLNERGYGRHFGTPRADWLLHRGLRRVLPEVEFTAADFYAHGGGNVLDAFRRFALAQGLFDRSGFVVTTRGMWGGYLHIAAARRFVLSTLRASRYAQTNLSAIAGRLDPSKFTVGMHVRLGDFAAPQPLADYRGKFNVSIPLEWYVRIGLELQRRCGQALQFLIASDGTPQQLRPLTEQLPCVLTGDLPNGDCSDLLALAQSDLLVCSVSSFSAWAAALSGAPYLWFEPSLQKHAEGFYSIWGHEPHQMETDGETRRAIHAWRKRPFLRPRGWPVGMLGGVPAEALAALNKRGPGRRLADAAADLVHYGVVPVRDLASRMHEEPGSASAHGASAVVHAQTEAACT
jgi:hypothetical protein